MEWSNPLQGMTVEESWEFFSSELKLLMNDFISKVNNNTIVPAVTLGCQCPTEPHRHESQAVFKPFKLFQQCDITMPKHFQ